MSNDTYTHPTAHVVCDSVPKVMRCDHCGDKFPMPFGAVRFVCAVMDAFIAEHRECKPGDKGGRTYTIQAKEGKPC